MKNQQDEDGITAEELKEITTEILFKICKEIWHTGKCPYDWCKFTFILIYKKRSLTDWNNYRRIALISHGSKVLLTVINEILKSLL